MKKIKSFIKKILTEQEIKKELNPWLSLLLQLVIAFIVEFIIEAASRHSLDKALLFVKTSTRAYFYNSCLIFVTSLFVLLFRKRRFWSLTVFATWLIIGISNGIVLSNRVTPLTGPDFKNISEALGVVKKYFTGYQIIGLIVAITILILFLIVYIFRCPKNKKRINIFISLGIMIACAFGFRELTNFYISKSVLSTYFSNIAFAYEDFGFPYCFTVTLIDTGINEPDNYSKDYILNIKNTDKKTVGETELLKKTPNVIVVQLESFFDIDRVNYIKTSQDVLPNWHALSEKYTSGYYTVPSIGAGTANTEFEALTGMPMRFFGPGEYPFKAILKTTTCDSSAYVFKDLGYATSAFHDNEANFYSRKVVYKNLGFDRFVSKEYMLGQDDVNYNGWMRDENLIGEITECIKMSEEKDYIFTVSVQPHGSYPEEQVIDDPEITIEGDVSNAVRYAWEYYANQMYEEDQFIADLIDAVDKLKEPTVIFFYGDHLPTMNLTDDQLTSKSTFETCFLMWDNIGLDKEEIDLNSYQATAYIFNRIGIHEGTIFNFQQANLVNKEENYNSKLQALQFDMLYGEKYAYEGKEYLVNPEYRLGMYDPEISEVEMISEEIFSITGEHFTKSCKVRSDTGSLRTIFVNENQMFVLGNLEEIQSLKVGVQSSSSTHKILAYGKNYIKNEEGIFEEEITLEENIEIDGDNVNETEEVLPRQR